MYLPESHCRYIVRAHQILDILNDVVDTKDEASGSVQDDHETASTERRLKTDQVPLTKDSMKYCGVMTPFRGMRVYTRCAMGMPGSETTLEELICRVLDDFLIKVYVAKLPDDLYINGNDIENLTSTWRKVLVTLSKTNLQLFAGKTTICPKKTSIFVWI